MRKGILGRGRREYSILELRNLLEKGRFILGFDKGIFLVNF